LQPPPIGCWKHGGSGTTAHDDDAGDVFEFAVAVSEAPARAFARERECDPERDARADIGEIVNRIGEQRDRSGREDDDKLKQRSQAEADEGNLEGANPAFARLQDRIGLFGNAVRMAVEPAQSAKNSAAVRVIVAPVRRDDDDDNACSLD
jgi:hypothetical protein